MGESEISARLKQAKERKLDDRTLAQRATDLAQDLLHASLKQLKSDERTLLGALSRLAADEKNRQFLQSLCAQVFHASTVETQANNLRRLMTDFGGVPTFFSTVGKLRFKAASMASRSMQGAAMAEVHRVFRSTFAELTLPTQLDKLSKRIRESAKDGMNHALNPLAPNVIGKKSAERYMKNLEAILAYKDSVGVVVQPWRLCPGMSPYSPESSAKSISKALRQLLKLANKPTSKRTLIVESGTSDTLPIVIEGFKLALAGAEFHQADIMLELPGYLKESTAALRDLTDWAQARAAKGAAPLKLLLVKGSHLAEEQMQAYTFGKGMNLSESKGETETRYKQLVHAAIAAKAKAICPVIGTHNLFDLAYALLDWARSGRTGLPPFVFIAGLGNHIGRMLAKEGASVTLSTSVSSEEEGTGFETYLQCLINELSRPDSYLASGYAVEANSIGWGRMRQQFLAALSGREEQHDRHDNAPAYRTTLHHVLTRAYVDEFYAAAQAECERRQEPLPLRICGSETPTALTCIHRSLTAPEQEDYRFQSADFAAVEKVLQQAEAASVRIPASTEERCTQILKLAKLLEKQRARLSAVLVRDAGYTMEDAETELRDAIGACYFYADSARQDGLLDGTQPTPLGVVVVCPGYEHPLTEAVSGIAAAWVMGNTIIYKPADNTTLLGYTLYALLQEAEFSEPAIQFLPCLDNQIAWKLTSDHRVNGVMWNGDKQASRHLINNHPTHTMLTSGTGASCVYLAPTADWHKAIRDVLHAVTRRSGQSKLCPHVLFAHAEVYDNQAFINALKDAAGSITAQSGSHEGAQLGPIAHQLSKSDLRALGSQKNGWTWLTQPMAAEIDSRIWTPGVCTGIDSAARFAQQVAGLPILGVVRVESTQEAIEAQQSVSEGRAAAIYSHDESEIELWSKHMECASLSINCCVQSRPGLQPCGTWAPALCGAAPLPGGPNYISVLAQWQETGRPQRRGKQRNIPFAPWDSLSPKPSPDEAMRLTTAADSISYWWENEFGITRTINPQPGQETTLCYKPVNLCLRVGKATSDIDLSIALMAALKAGCHVQVSTATLRAWMPRCLEQLGVPIHVENRGEFESRFSAMASDGVWVRDTAATEQTLAAASACNLRLCNAEVLGNGRLELLHYLREQVTTRCTARHGKL